MTGSKDSAQGEPTLADLRCTVCGDPLSLLPDSNPLLFHCREGHFISIDQLLTLSLSRIGAEVAIEIRRWEARADILRGMTRSALAAGHLMVAADFNEALLRIEERIGSLSRMSPAEDRKG